MKRNRLETLCTILTISVKGIKKTHIMYRANLSHSQLEKFLKILINKELLEKSKGAYKTTTKGLVFIEECKKIQALLGEDDNKSKIYSMEAPL